MQAAEQLTLGVSESKAVHCHRKLKFCAKLGFAILTNFVNTLENKAMLSSLANRLLDVECNIEDSGKLISCDCDVHKIFGRSATPTITKL
ncbi:unnamed protein product [Mesocestoides corti]|uniref:HNHc domain-containing protein n=1 Tax=Mesocestoides corti TaxID=53468 RepID=A0A0R3U4M9_MESCO|nr:unnamed protein product [Mesocestoides corti]